ncbi:hypothetical protein [Rhodoplanes azumiensis]|uniref:Uncharacterized protein n=1 Tax=Rhodoplanes azumiensis TaxID=1897628 RepID=A0ABW5AQQ7_9BRAD
MFSPRADHRADGPASRPAQAAHAAQARAVHARVVLDDHARLPWRFFGRLTAAVLAGLPGPAARRA